MSVVVLMPPAVEPGLPPMNMRSIISIFAAAGHGTGIYAVKTCRSGGTGLEKGCEQSFAVAHIHIQIVPLQKQQ